MGDTSSDPVVSLTLSGTGIVNNTDGHELYPQAVQAAPTLATNGARNIIYLKNDAGITQGDGLTFTQLIAQGGNRVLAVSAVRFSFSITRLPASRV